MPNAIQLGVLDLELGWRRALRELAERRAFVRHPFHDRLVEQDLDAWLADLGRKIAEGTYRPAACRVVPIPKPHGQIRPGAELRLVDQVVYNALVHSMRERVLAGVGAQHDSPDYSYHLHHNATQADWFESFFARWQAFDRDSIQVLDATDGFVVVADVAGYYENIDLSTLRSDLNGLGVDADVLAVLMDCLHRWARIQRRGIPQGHERRTCSRSSTFVPLTFR